MQIPAPLPSDSDKVVNLLHSAAFFDRVGDAEEALLCLRQAAECAGESGDDARTLALARSAAELSTDAGSGVRERRLPGPPPRSRPAPLSDKPAPEEEPVLLLKRTVPHSKPPGGPRESLEAKEDKPPESRSTLTPPPLPRDRANGSHPPVASARPSTSSRPAPPSLRSRTSAPPSSKAPIRSVQTPARATNGWSRAPASVRASSVASRAPEDAPEPAPEVARPGLRQAARVSVERSSSDPGLLLVRVLEEGAAAPAGCTEAFLVSVDPNARPFAG